MLVSFYVDHSALYYFNHFSVLQMMLCDYISRLYLCAALEDVQSELFDLKTKYDEATSAK